MRAVGMMDILWPHFCSPGLRGDVGIGEREGASGQGAAVGSSVYMCTCIYLLHPLHMGERMGERMHAKWCSDTSG